MRRHPIPVVAACIVERNPTRVLISKKKEAEDEKGIKRNPELVGLWEFPGGMMEGKETPEEALQREIWEELEGVIVQPDKLIDAKTVCFKDKKPYLVLFYLCHSPYLLEDIEGCMYITKRDIPSIRDKVIKGDLDVLYKVFEEVG